MQEMIFCQSCGMPMKKDEDYGTEASGGKNADYCCYCYKNGAFTFSGGMDEMIEICVPHMVSDTMTADQARADMKKWFPTLKRWMDQA